MRAAQIKVHIKKACCIICLLLLSAFISSCSVEEYLPPEKEDEVDIKDTLTLSLYSTDSLAPYYVRTRTNKETLSLCFNGLFIVKNDLVAECELAESYMQDGNTVNITLKDGVCFADGTPVTAADCVYSYTLASEENSVYRSYFSHIISFEALSDNVFSVAFRDDNINNINLLDIPVIKSGSELYGYAIGAGKYYMKLSPSGTDGEDIIRFYVNNYYGFESEVSFKTIDVRLFSSSEELLYAFNYGNVDVAYSDLSNGPVSFRTDAESVTYITNSMTYAVLNRNREIFTKYTNISTAISYIISRDAIDKQILRGCGRAVWYPFNPSWSKCVAVSFASDIYSEEVYVSSFFNGRWYRNPETLQLEWFGERIKLDIIVDADNAFESAVANMIAENLTAFGAESTVRVLSDEDYASEMKKGNYDIRIDSSKIPANMNIIPLLKSAGFTVTDELSAAAESFYSGNTSLLEFNAAFQKELPLIPLYFTDGAMAVSMRVQGSVTPVPGNMFSGIESWSIRQTN